MIDYITGRLIDKTPTKAVVVAGGIGYAVLISLATYEKLPETGEETALYTHLAVREDALTLYGFATVAERDAFLLLTSVNGVGPKIAIGILSSTGIDVLRENIAAGNVAVLTRLPGIGKKTAERIVVELRDRIGGIDARVATFGEQRHETREEALAALLALGYTRPASEKALRDVMKDGEEESVEGLIKGALRRMNG